MKHRKYHKEILDAFKEIGNHRYGEAVREDRKSKLEHLGISAPALRKRVKQKFSFYDLPEDQILAVWSDLWLNSKYADVLFAALEYYRARFKKGLPPGIWNVVQGWAPRVDNWAHADELSRLYSHVLEADQEAVMPQILEWNRAESQWLRRISLVSLLHYTGKNPVFLTPKQVLPLVSNCLDDAREYVQKAVGWVLREMGNVYPQEIETYLRKNATRLQSPAFSRAIERRDSAVKSDLRAMWKKSRRT